jgi:hypothetical protein
MPKLLHRRRYAAAAFAVLLVELFIALVVRDRVVRPYLGDSLAVILVYLALRAMLPLSVRAASGLAFAIACAVELGQLVHLVDRLGLGGNRAARVVLGTGFDPTDFLAYGGGAILVLVIEHLRRGREGDSAAPAQPPPVSSSTHSA